MLDLICSFIKDWDYWKSVSRNRDKILNKIQQNKVDFNSFMRPDKFQIQDL